MNARFLPCVTFLFAASINACAISTSAGTDASAEAVGHEANAVTSAPHIELIPIRNACSLEKKSYSNHGTLTLPAFFDDCAARSMTAPIASYFAAASAEAAMLVADLHDCAARVHALATCPMVETDNHCPLDSSTSVSSRVLAIAGPKQQCFTAEANAYVELGVLEETRNACAMLLAESQAAFQLGCWVSPSASAAQADALEARGVAIAQHIAEASSACTSLDEACASGSKSTMKRPQGRD